MPSETKNRFLLLYGSQTGQAKAITEEVLEKSANFGLHADLHCLGQTERKFNIERERCVVFVVSTTGDGEPPDTVQKFWRRLKKKTLPNNHLEHLHFTLLGLGDSNYTNFCKCGKSLERRLDQLGARRFYPCGWADDGVGLEVAVEPWIDGLLPAVRGFLGLPPVYPDVTMEVLPYPYNDSSVSENTTSSRSGAENSESDPSERNSEQQEITANGNSVSHISDYPDRTGAIDVQNGSENGDCCDSLSENKTIVSDKGHTNTDRVVSVNGRTCGETVATNSAHVGLVSVQNLTTSCAVLNESSLTLPLQPPSYLSIHYNKDVHMDVANLPFQNNCPLPSAASDITMATIVSVTRLTRDDAMKTALDIELCTNAPLGYQPGDAISVICPNPATEVDQLLDRLCVKEEKSLCYELSVLGDTRKRNAAVPAHLPLQACLTHIFTTCLDIRQPPKKALLRVFVEHTRDPREKRRLQELCSKQGAQDYAKFIRESSLSILDILLSFPSCHPPVTRLLEYLPRLLPRPYSITSFPLTETDRLHFVFNVVEIEHGDGRMYDRRGVCTGWLEAITHDKLPTSTVEDRFAKMSLATVDKIPIFSRTNQHFHMPDDISIPLLLIGPGTGVAPFVGFLQHREMLLKETVPAKKIGETWLFFGCRHSDRDYLYREKLEGLERSGALTRLFVSFSRDKQPPDKPKYVQDNLLCYGSHVVSLIEDKNATVFVCGDAKNMAKNINTAFTEIYQAVKGWTLEDAKCHLMKLRLHKRYLEDVWT